MQTLRLLLKAWIAFCCLLTAVTLTLPTVAAEMVVGRNSSSAAVGTTNGMNATLPVVPVRVILLCDDAEYKECVNATGLMAAEAASWTFSSPSLLPTMSSSSLTKTKKSALPRQTPPIFPPPKHKIALNVSVVRIRDDSPQQLRTLSALLGRNESEGSDASSTGSDAMNRESNAGYMESDVLIAIGDSGAVQTATVLASGLGKPLMGYVHDDSWKDVYKVGQSHYV
jgi:hypothetical protein